ncbi:VOC family protein [Actinoplanes oblitus]|uniref:VOC family protein n=1 Tax=Actinoplanes oblitus TaxID=3040509 RepID=A0ABY8WB82_9ACTN|nr:VOC family protein [Actinoplanes oblitus]WIM92970.1 VOC family protein [Actinoplanes oblitus]
MDVAAHTPGTVCWIDIGAPDPDATAAFYGELFGWTYTASGADGYRAALLDGRAVSGLGPAEDPGPPYWTAVLSVEDIDAAAAAFAAAGARIVVPPAPVAELGHAAVVVDPVGAPVSLWQPGTQTGMQAVGEHGAFASIELLTGRPDEASDFYRRVLGWHLDGTERRPETGVRGTPPPSPTPQPSLWLVNFTSDDVDATVTSALRLGATHAGLDCGATVLLRDPAGALFGIVATR